MILYNYKSYAYHFRKCMTSLQVSKLNNILYKLYNIIEGNCNTYMNFLNFLTAGASLLNFNLQNLASSAVFNQDLAATGDQKSEVILPKPVIPTLTEQETKQMKQEMELITQKQQLINQYMHMNIQLLNQKLQNLEKLPSPPTLEQKDKMKESRDLKDSQDEGNDETKNNRKKNKKINKCGHDDKQHYAKGLCNNCYHKFGRNKKPWKCPHEKLYAAGMCQNCYINNYNRKKRLQKDGSQAEFLDLKIEESIQDECESSKQEKQQLK